MQELPYLNKGEKKNNKKFIQQFVQYSVQTGQLR